MEVGATIARSKLADATKPAVRWGAGHLVPRTAMAMAARKGDLQGRLIAVGRGGGDPFALFEQMRAAGPLYRAKFAYVTTSLACVREVLSSPDFRTGFDTDRLRGITGRLFAWSVDPQRLGPLEPPSLLVTEPPDHTRYRRLVSRVFSARAVADLRGRTQQIADGLLDGVAGRTQFDAVREYCTLLPVTVIAEILGVPIAERDRILAFGEAAAPSLDLGLTWRQFRRVESALADFEGWLESHLRQLAAHPGDDLLSRLVAARDDGVGLTERELKATAGLILAAGFETTVNLLSNGTALLAAHPDQRRMLAENPSLWPNAVEEILRFDPPVLLTGRTAHRDTSVAGVPMRRGTMVTTALAAANRDPEVFAAPDRFDITRENAREHVSFSAGRHFCLGAALARMEGEVGLATLFDRYPDLRVLPGATRRETRILRGYRTLPVSTVPLNR